MDGAREDVVREIFMHGNMPYAVVDWDDGTWDKLAVGYLERRGI